MTENQRNEEITLYMFDKTEVKEINRAVLVGLNAPGLTREENATDESLDELAALLDKLAE